MTENPLLIEVIRREIQERGPITFARFMELALYHPEHGYYTSGRARIGREGDFITSVSVGPVLGRFLGMQFVQMWEALNKPNPFVLLELGSHRGWLAHDIQQWAAEQRPDFAAVMDYWTCEKRRRESPAPAAGGRWFQDWSQIEPDSVTGCIFSNELVDAFPVHRIRRAAFGGRFFADLQTSPTNFDWDELYVALGQQGFEWKPGPLSIQWKLMPGTLRSFPSPEGYTTEVHLASLVWLHQMSLILKRGFLLTIDYGYTEAEYYAPHRMEGTLRCYYRHRANDELLERIGEQDITAHVNFGALITEGIRLGLDFTSLTDQAHFLIGVGQEEIERIVQTRPGQPDKIRRQLQTLLNPADMGRTFKVLIQQKCVDVKPSGPKYRRPL